MSEKYAALEKKIFILNKENADLYRVNKDLRHELFGLRLLATILLIANVVVIMKLKGA